MKEKIINFYTAKTFFLLYVTEIETNLIDTIHLFCNRYEKTLILDILSDFNEKYIDYTLLKERLLKWSEMHLKQEVKVLRHDYFGSNSNITSKLETILKPLQKQDKDFIRVKVR